MEVWEQRYRSGDVPWDSGAPSQELVRALNTHAIRPGRVLEAGCGTGTNAVFLAQQGFAVTACDLSETALTAARARVAEAGVAVRLLAADLLGSPDLGGPFDLVFDRGVYHVLRRVGAGPYLTLLGRVLAPGALYLVLTGNANEVSEVGPPRMHAHELCAELQPWFDLVELREYRWSPVRVDGQIATPLGWSGLFRRAARSGEPAAAG